jgi:polar amino acid transport system substrate-binding protein
MASITDTRQREQVVDMVTYYAAGTMWARRPGTQVTPDNACGIRVAVQSTTTQQVDDLPARSSACLAAGAPPITIVSFDGQDQATNAVILGQADAMAADSPVTGYAVKLSNGKLSTAGPPYDMAPYGWAVAKASPLGQALQQALTRLIENGRYAGILSSWGVEAGAINHSQINGATY